MKDPNPREWQRQKYWQGQGLLSRDLNDLASREDSLRWWHNRSVLHDAYGVVDGLQFQFDSNENRATVSAGLAYDCFGRELLLCQPCTIALSDGEIPEEGLTLLIAYPENGSASEPCGTPGACLPAGRPRADCRLLKWHAGERVSIRDGVALGRVKPGPNGVEQSEAFRPFPTRRLARPFIANGATASGNTPWRPWMLALDKDQEPHLAGLETPVNTAEAGFSETPCYFAWHQGSLWQPNVAAPLFRVFMKTPIFLNARARIAQGPAVIKLMQILNGGLAHIAEPEVDGFLYRIWLPFLGRATGGGFGAEQLRLFARELTVCWLGIEHLAGANEVEDGNIRRNRFC